MSIVNHVRRRGAQALALVTGLGLSAAAMAQTAPAIPDATDMITNITGKQSGYATVMFALALTAVGILVGVKWIKRARGAA